MAYLGQTYELLTGGSYSGDLSWNKPHTDIDNCFKLYRMTAGEAFVVDHERAYRLEAGKLYFINGNRLCRQYCDSSFATLWLHFIPKDLSVYRGLLSIPTVEALSPDVIDMGGVLPAVERLLEPSPAAARGRVVDMLRVQSSLQAVTLELLGRYPSCLSAVPSEIRRVEPAIRYINDRYEEVVSLSRLADMCCMSPNYFHKMFKAAMGMTPARYVALLRMNAALQMLGDAGLPIKDIAYELGFSDDAHFCRSFKKYYGMSPAQYRKQKGNIII